MDIERMKALNRYTHIDFDELANADIHDPIVFIGNTMEYRELNNCLINRQPISIISPYCTGKYTAVMKVCDQNGFYHEDDFSGELFQELPLYDHDTVFIIRNPKKSSLLEQYINSDGRLVLLYDDVRVKPLTKNVIRFKTPTHDMIEQYKKEKGYDMQIALEMKETIEKQTIARYLKHGNIFPLPIHTHRWVAFNFSDNEQILKICAKAKDTDDEHVYYGLMNLIRYRKSINLRFPTWSKQKTVNE